MAKNSQNLNKVKKPNPSKTKREFSAGGVVFKKDKGKTTFLIVQPKGTDRFQLPKGHIEKDESSVNAAVRETKEEGGVTTRAIQKIGNQQYFFFWDGERIFKIVIFYLLEYLSGDPKDHDKEVERAEFLEFEKALEKLTFKRDKEFITKAKELLAQGIQENLI